MVVVQAVYIFKLHGEGVLNLSILYHMQQLLCNTVPEVVEDRSHSAAQIEVQTV